MIDLEPHGDGVILPVQARPKARRNGVVGEHAGRLKVAVTEPPDKGKANDALVRVLADALGVKRSQVELIAGQASAAKKFLVTGVPRDELSHTIEMLLAESPDRGAKDDSY